MKNRRTFLKALGGVTAAGSLSGFTPFIPNELQAALDDKGIHGKEFLEFPLYPTSSEWVRSPWVVK